MIGKLSFMSRLTCVIVCFRLKVTSRTSSLTLASPDNTIEQADSALTRGWSSARSGPEGCDYLVSSVYLAVLCSVMKGLFLISNLSSLISPATLFLTMRCVNIVRIVYSLHATEAEVEDGH